MATTIDSNNNVDSNTNTAMETYVAQASSFGGQLWTLMFIAAILGLGKGGVPGFATVATAMTVLTAPEGCLGLAVGLQVPILTMIDIAAAYLHADHLDWSTVWLLLPFSLLGMTLGVAVQTYVWKDDDASARLFVGMILLSVLLLRTYQPILDFLSPLLRRILLRLGLQRWIPLLRLAPKRSSFAALKHKDSSLEYSSGSHNSSNHVDVEHGSHYAASHNTSTMNSKQQQQQHYYLWAIIVGLVGGAATMLTNSMGPILNVYLLSIRQLSPSSYIGTRAMFFCFLNIGKIPLRVVSGTLGWTMLPLAGGLGLVSVLGVYCAKPIMLSMKEPTFVALELGVVAFAGIRLVWMGMHY